MRFSQIFEDYADIACELPHFLRHTEYSFGFDDSNDESSEPGDIFRTGPPWLGKIAIFILLSVGI